MPAPSGSPRAARPRVIIDPWFRTMDELFDPSDLERLTDVADIVWGRDEPLPTEILHDEVVTATAVVFASWSHGSEAVRGAPEQTVQTPAN